MLGSLSLIKKQTNKQKTKQGIPTVAVFGNNSEILNCKPV
jgi:hypothetical protein